ncbi:MULTISPECIES: Na+/H+ antiporter NhaC family protein [Haloferax]|uniref:Na+/H+ antiporter NhaC family protein n=2 Tax=Haloferax TaxID=2251 RepID=A0A6G1YXU0_9EURY|nr:MULTISPECIES: Na+/H+ antiporter NhaC family protein [Haloferax]KAB1186548.1 Na+/H+ antiporter NhaC family protein [Haloferax sp. CBA1149]MRW79159.1 Na+/H+ antiporter NhaC family protein [Haloferax marinisediminis]
MASEFGVLSLVPPLLAIVLAVATRRAMLSLFIGIWVGGIIYTGGTGVAQLYDWIVSSIGGSTFNAKILVFTLQIGAGIALIWRLGGAIAITNFATKRIDSHRKIGIATWLLGILWNFDDYANNAIVGSSMKNLADELKMSREKLAYLLDSTAAPVATIGISSWVAFEIGLIANQYEELGIQAETPSAAATFIQSIPFNVYAILAIAMVGIIVITQRDFGEMLDAESRAQRTGDVIREDAQPLQNIKDELGEPLSDNAPLRVFFLPVIALVSVVIGGAAMMGYAPGRTPVEMVSNTDVATALVWGSFAMVTMAVVVGLSEDIMSLGQSMETILDGFGTMLPAVSILVLAWSIGAVASALGTGAYVTQYAEGVVSPMMVPVVVFVTSAFISFAIGTSWGTMSIMTPIVIPLAWAIGGNDPSFIAVAIGAMFSGAIFGDNCSPISDTTVLASTFAGSDHIDHVRTQMYYAFTVLLATIVVYFLYGATNLSPLVLLPVGILTLVGLVYGFSELDARRKNLSAKPTSSNASTRNVSSDD